MKETKLGTRCDAIRETGGRVADGCRGSKRERKETVATQRKKDSKTQK